MPRKSQKKGIIMEFDLVMRKAAECNNFILSEKQYEMFAKYYKLLIEANSYMNLTALTGVEDVVTKHFIDSMMAYDKKIFENNKNVVDIGSGAGFPGIPLKILDDGLNLTLMDSVGKKVHFLEKVVEELNLTDVMCVYIRAEDAARNKKMREKFDIAVSRAVAPLNVLAEYALPFVKVGGKMLALKGKKVGEEVEQAKKAIELLGGTDIDVKEVKIWGLEDKRAIVTINKTKITPNTFPRRAGTPSKKPL